MRNRFDKELEILNGEMVEMGKLCEEATLGAAKAFVSGDVALAKEIKENAIEIDHLERDIEQHCMKLLLHQQPVAKDLRQISAALKMITDLERIGDQAEDIAGITIYLNGKDTPKVGSIMNMACAASKLVSDSVEAFVKKDMDIAESIIKGDDEIDEYFDKVRENIIHLIQEKPEEGKVALDFLMAAKYFERIGDHATNIAEWVIYMVTGVHKVDELYNNTNFVSTR